MSEHSHLEKVKEYFNSKLDSFGATHQGVDYNSTDSQERRFFELTKIIGTTRKYSLLDFGSGYGAMYDYLLKIGHNLHYVGYDIAEPMIEKGREVHPNNPQCIFTSNIEDIPTLDYAVLSGTFNMKLDIDISVWEHTILEGLHHMDEHASRGFAFNMLTMYSDEDKMRSDLYYGDPSFYFDYCKRNFARNVALLHDYGLYDFTILVRKG